MAGIISITTHSAFLRNRNYFLNWSHFPVLARETCQRPIFPISILQEQLQIYLLFQISPKNGCNNLYYHPFSLSKGQKLFSYLTSLSRRSPVNRSPPIFPISIVQGQLQIYLLFQMSTKNGCNNLYYHPFSLSKGQNLFSYLTSLSRRGPVNPSTPNFPISILQEQLQIYLLFQMSPKNGFNNLY